MKKKERTQVMAGITRSQMSWVVLIISLVVGTMTWLTGHLFASVGGAVLLGFGVYFCFRWAFNENPEKYKNRQAEFDKGLDQWGL